MRVLLVTPPMTQLNSPYPATPYLTGALRRMGFEVEQKDFSLLLALKIFSRRGLLALFQEAEKKKSKLSPQTRWMLKEKKAYLSSIDRVIPLLQKRDESAATDILKGKLLPQNPWRGKSTPEGRIFLENLDHVFETLEEQERARHLASLYLGDLARLLSEAVDPSFGLSRWGERYASNQPTFAPLRKALKKKDNLLDRLLRELVKEHILKADFDVVGFTTPFPGNVYAAFRMAEEIKKKKPKCVTLWGGGFVNTELRQLREPEVFDYFDYVTLDDGFRPLELILRQIEAPAPLPKLKRTFVRQASGKKKTVQFHDNVPFVHDMPFAEVGVPDYGGLDFSRYLCLLEIPNPMHRLWSDEKWNKLIVAHGCYWKKCTFCDVSLDYIKRYEVSPAAEFVDHMEKLMRENQVNGFHFVDEAAPPAALRAISEEIIRRKLEVTWWGNIRFEKSFTAELAQLMRDSGCIAVTGGLEVASNRLLKLIQKGVTVEQVVEVTKNFTDAGILVHAYLMYGFPTQTLQDFSDSMEYVRQLFEQGCLQSGFWHQFAATAHSPVGLNPKDYGIRVETLAQAPAFAQNEIAYSEKSRIDWSIYDAGLRKSIYNYMLGVGWQEDVRHWFQERLPRTKVPRDFVLQTLLKASQ